VGAVYKIRGRCFCLGNTNLRLAISVEGVIYYWWIILHARVQAFKWYIDGLLIALVYENIAARPSATALEFTSVPLDASAVLEQRLISASY
jgi:hypothetical protein